MIWLFVLFSSHNLSMNLCDLILVASDRTIKFRKRMAFEVPLQKALSQAKKKKTKRTWILSCSLFISTCNYVLVLSRCRIFHSWQRLTLIIASYSIATVIRRSDETTMTEVIWLLWNFNSCKWEHLKFIRVVVCFTVPSKCCDFDSNHFSFHLFFPFNSLFSLSVLLFV